MDEKTTAKVTTLLTPDDKRKLRQVAYDSKRNVSDYVRVLILEAIEGWERAKAKQGNG